MWLNPAGWFALAAVAGPILVHILARRRADPLLFPSLRFIHASRLAAVRRHVLEDRWLLLLRAAILAAAVAAVAGPLLLTTARRAAWDARIARAIVVDAESRSAAERVEALAATAFTTRTFETHDLADGIRRARAWLERSPPARREIVVVSPFPLGSLTAEQAAVSDGVGIRFERAGSLPARRTIPGNAVFGAEAAGGVSAPAERPALVVQQTIELEGPQTIVSEAIGRPAARFPIDVFPPSAAGRAAIDAVIAERVWMAPANRRARLVTMDPSVDRAVIANPRPLTEPWMADATAAIVRDRDVQAMAAGVPADLADPQFATSPWIVLARAAGGRPMAVAASASTNLLVVSAAPAAHAFTPVLLRSIAAGLGSPGDFRSSDVLAMTDARLQAWSRPPSPVGDKAFKAVERDDRRWFWGIALMLLGVETWIRRSRPIEAERADARVA